MVLVYIKYDIKKMVSQKLKDMSQLVDSVRKIRKLNLEKRKRINVIQKDKTILVAFAESEEVINDSYSESS